MVYHYMDAKCVLMGNTPLGDIEILFNKTSPETVSPSSKNKTPTPRANMRVRLARERQSIEISRVMSSASGKPGASQEEWTKKVLPFDPRELTRNLGSLDRQEKTGIGRLLDFLKLCEAVEALDSDTLDIKMASQATSSETRKLGSMRDRSESLQSSLETIATPLTSVRIPPRPPKLSCLASSRSRSSLTKT
jgi:hypothetical protein